MADFLKASFLSSGSHQSDRQVSRFLGSRIMRKKPAAGTNQQDSEMRQRNLTSMLDGSSQIIDQDVSQFLKKDDPSALQIQ